MRFISLIRPIRPIITITMEKRFYLSQTDKKIGGVCGGLAEYFEFDATLIRLAAFLVIWLYGLGLIAYIVTWIVAPKGPDKGQQYESDMNSRLHGNN